MGIMHVFHIPGQRFRYIPVVHDFPVSIPLPGTQMDFVNQHGIVIRIVVGAAFSPASIMPLVSQTFHYGRGIWPQLRSKTVRVAF